MYYLDQEIKCFLFAGHGIAGVRQLDFLILPPAKNPDWEKFGQIHFFLR
ncbi:hypothetical protein ES708_19005 [subsurface metagenome]